MSVTRRGRFDYEGTADEVHAAQLEEIFDEFLARVIREARDVGLALRENGFPHTADALGLTTGQDMDKERT